jgi:dolichol kinase
MKALFRRNQPATPFNIKRGLMHVIVGLGIATVGFLLSRPLFLSILITVSVLWCAVDLLRLRFAKLGNLFVKSFALLLREYEKSRVTGATFLLLGCLISFIIFDKETAVLAVSFLAVGDPLAHLVKDKLIKNPSIYRLIGEAAACLIASSGVGLLWWYYAGFSASIGVIGAGAVTASLVQSLSVPPDDNFTIPILAGLVMWLTALII